MNLNVDSVSIPVIASGGCGELGYLYDKIHNIQQHIFNLH